MENKADVAWWQERQNQASALYKGIVRRSLYLIMRDGVRIAVDIYLPARLGSGERLPAILGQTRYYRRMRLRWPFSWLMSKPDPLIRRFVESGYAWIVVDVRGSGASFGSRQMEWSPDEVRDGTEVVDWIVAQPWSNGVVGTTGISYDGTAAEMLLTNAHPAVKAAIIRYSLFDIYADILRPGGIFHDRFMRVWSELNDALDRNAPGPFFGRHVGWRAALSMEGVAPVDEDRRNRHSRRAAVQAHVGNYQIYETGLQIEYRDDHSDAGLSTDQFSPHAFLDAVQASGAAIYSWSGWFDCAYTLSAIKRFLNLRAPGGRLILGPWDHGGGQSPDPFSEDHKSYFDHHGEMLRFFDYHLKGIQNGVEAEKPVHYFTMGEGMWKLADVWPPPGFEPTPFYLAKGKTLRPGSPPEAVDKVYPHPPGADVYQVDGSAGSGLGSRWYSAVNVDGLPIRYDDRKERSAKLLVYTSPPFERDAELTGHPIVRLFIRATAPDVYLFVYLEDEGQEGEVRYVTEGRLRAIHRRVSQEPSPYALPAAVPYHTFRREDAMPLVPGEPAEIVFDLLPISYLIKKGHSVRVAIAGADRDNFALPSSPLPEIEVLYGGTHPSHISLPLAAR